MTATEWVDRITALAPGARADLERALDTRVPYCPVKPHPIQRAFLLLDPCLEVMFGGAAGGSKALALDTPIPTSTGWTAMGDLHAGDQVFDRDGKPCRVTIAHPVQFGQKCYQVTLSDDSRLVADAGHLWWVFNQGDLAAAIRRDPEWRARRRDRRPKRGTGKKPWLAEMNSRNHRGILPPPEGRLKRTDELVDIGRRDAIPVAGPLELPDVELPIPPYTLGAWLGDGTSSNGNVTSADPEVIERIRADGWQVTRIPSTKYGWNVRALMTSLRAVGLIEGRKVAGTKRIPRVYLRASAAQRLDLLRGLVDTDGCVGRDGQVSIVQVRRELLLDIAELATSLGVKVTVREFRAKLKGKDRGPVWRVSWTAPWLDCALLPRKRERLKAAKGRTGHRRYVQSVEPVPSVPVRCITVDSPTGTFLAGERMVPTHNSWALLMAALRYAEHPGYGALLLRETLTILEAEPNGLIPILGNWLDTGPARWAPRTRTWHFPSGATVGFGYLQDPEDHRRYKGPSWHFIGIDQAEEIRPKHYLFMFSRLRREAESRLPVRFRCTSNPGGRAHDFLANRFRVVERDLDPRGGRAFLPSFLEDNPALDQAEYERSLAQLGELEYAQMRHGDWGATVAGAMFKVHLLQALNAPPPGLRLVRAWDLAATEAVSGTDPDWSAGVLLGRRGQTVQDDDALEVVLDVTRDRLEPAGVDAMMRNVAAQDGPNVPIVVEQESRSAGKREIGYVRRNIRSLGAGYRVLGVEPVGTKLERASPAARWMNAGKMGTVGGPWLGDLITELRQIGPDYKGHDDQMDALAIAHNYLDGRRTRPGVGQQLAESRMPEPPPRP